MPHSFLRHDNVARRLDGMESKELIPLIKSGAFGKPVLKRGRYFFVTESGFNTFCAAHDIFDGQTGELKPIHARTEAEFDRKLRVLEAGSG